MDITDKVVSPAKHERVKVVEAISVSSLNAHQSSDTPPDYWPSRSYPIGVPVIRNTVLKNS